MEAPHFLIAVLMQTYPAFGDNGGRSRNCCKGVCSTQNRTTLPAESNATHLSGARLVDAVGLPVVVWVLAHLQHAQAPHAAEEGAQFYLLPDSERKGR